jgi:hypothetical protein
MRADGTLNRLIGMRIAVTPLPLVMPPHIDRVALRESTSLVHCTFPTRAP